MRAVVLLAIGLLGTAALFDAEPLWVPGVALALTALVAAGWVLAGTVGTVIERSIGVRRVVEDEPVPVTVLARPALTILPGTTLEDPLLPRPLALSGGAGTHRVRIEARFSRRGRRVLAQPAIEVRDPLGLLRQRVQGSGEDDVLLVLPRVEPVVAARTRGSDGRLGRRRTTAGAAEVELDGLRPHRAGAPASRIFWPALARTGELLERRMLPEADARPLIALDTRAAPTDDDLDAAVRATASLAVALATGGGCAVLLPGDRRATPLDPGLQGWSALHVRLALLEGGGSPPAGALNARRGALIWVSARPLERMPRALAHAPAASRLLVVPGNLPGRRPAFTVAGCTGYLLSAGEVGAAA